MEIPENVRALLWEYETGGSLAPQCEDVVLERVMQRGGWAESVLRAQTDASA